MPLQTTDRCDRCHEPLGIKCDRDAHGCARALLFGLYVKEESTLIERVYRFYCCKDCMDESK